MSPIPISDSLKFTQPRFERPNSNLAAFGHHGGAISVIILSAVVVPSQPPVCPGAPQNSRSYPTCTTAPHHTNSPKPQRKLLAKVHSFIASLIPNFYKFHFLLDHHHHLRMEEQSRPHGEKTFLKKHTMSGTL